MWPKKSVTLWFALLILSLACASSFAAEKIASATSPDVLKQQITESERSLKDLETLVQACGNCSEEAQLSGSLAELRQYIAYLHVRLDSIRQEVALKKPAPKPVEVAQTVEAAKPTETPAPVEVAAAPAPASTQEIEKRLDDMSKMMAEILAGMKTPAAAPTPAKVVGDDMIASRGGTMVVAPKEEPVKLATPTAATPAEPVKQTTPGVSLPELNFKFEGTGFFAYRHDASETDGQTNDFEILRMNFGIKYFASNDLTLRYLTDIARESGNGKIDANAKYAYADWKVHKNFNLLIGVQGTYNWVPAEAAWGYRSILWSPMEAFGDYFGTWSKKYTTYLDTWAETDPAIETEYFNATQATRNKMGAAADLGVSVAYNSPKALYANFMIRNGTGFRKAEDDMFKNFSLLAGKYFMNKTVHVSAFAEVEPWKGLDDAGDNTGYMNLGWDVTASYTEKDKFTAGVDVNSKHFDGTEPITGMCYSGFVHGFLKPNKLKAIARYDIYQTGFNDAPVMPGDEAFQSNGNRTVLGLDFLAHKNISIIPNFQVISYEDSSLKPVKSGYVHMQFKW